MKAAVQRHRATNSILWDSSIAAALLSVGIGVYFAVAPASAFVSTSYDVHREILPIRAWAAVFILKGSAALWCLLGQRLWRSSATVMISGGVPLYLFWAFGFAVSAVQNRWLGTFIGLVLTFAAFMHYQLGKAMGRESRRQQER